MKIYNKKCREEETTTTYKSSVNGSMVTETIHRTIQASSFNRAVSHMNNEVCCFITAFRGEYSRKENQKRNKQLEADLKNSGLTFIKADGGFIENAGTENATRVTEESFCVINNRYTDEDFIDLMCDLCGKYNQDAVLITIPQYQDRTHKKVMDVIGIYYDRNGHYDKGDVFHNATVQDAELYFTNIHGKDFVLSSCGLIEHKTNDMDTRNFSTRFNASRIFAAKYPHLNRHKIF